MKSKISIQKGLGVNTFVHVISKILSVFSLLVQIIFPFVNLDYS